MLCDTSIDQPPPCLVAIQFNGPRAPALYFLDLVIEPEGAVPGDMVFAPIVEVDERAVAILLGLGKSRKWA